MKNNVILGKKLIICKYVTRNGKRIDHKNASGFAFWVSVDESCQETA